MTCVKIGLTQNCLFSSTVFAEALERESQKEALEDKNATVEEADHEG